MDRGTGTGAGAGLALHGRALVAHHRRDRQPRSHARLSGRRRSAWRRDRIPAPRWSGPRPTATASCWRSAAPRRCSCGQDGSSTARGLHAPELALRFEGRSGTPPPTPYLLQGELLRPGRPLALLATDLSGPRACRPWRPCHRSISRDAAGSGRTRSGSRRSTMWSTRRARRRSMPRSGNIGRSFRTARWSRTIPASARSSRPPDRQRSDFVLVGPEGHGMAGLVELFGIESPGLTASWPMACEVARAARPARAQPTTSPDRSRPDR